MAVSSRKNDDPLATRPVSEEAGAAQSPRRPALRKALLCTLGPRSLDGETISGLEALGVTSFRINMSHTDLDQLGHLIESISSRTHVPICLDTEGAQVRTGAVGTGTCVQRGSHVRLVPPGPVGDATTIPLTPGAIFDTLEPGTRASIDFDSATLRVDHVAEGSASATVLVGGEIGSRKAVTLFPRTPLPTFSEKDRRAIPVAHERGVREFALSFCESAQAVHELRTLTGRDSTIIAKIESRAGVLALSEIAGSADAILIDRGDLSREVRLEAIPLLQKAIIRKANALGVPVYVATNLLESMVTRRAPTRAEVNDVINTLLDGADGLVLAAETAIGAYPVEAARMISSLMREYGRSLDGYRIDDLLGEHPLA